MAGEGRFRHLRQRMFARYYDKVQKRHEEHIAARKRRLLGDLRGTVLELGPGTGVNFDYLSRDIRWIGVEPSPYMREELRARAERLGFEPSFRDLRGNGLDVEDGSADVVLSTLVLCSVPDPAATVKEIRRVLKPGGRFVFIEHVAAPRGSWLRRVQRLVRPVTRFVADGCCPDRELGRTIESAGFERVEMGAFRVQVNLISKVASPHIIGTAHASGKPA